MNHSHSHHARGFMLVMALMLLAIIGTAAAAMARRSMSQAAIAVQAEKDLQRRWAMRSIATTLSGSAGLLIEVAQVKQEQPIQAMRYQLVLNHTAVRVLLTDEQVKPHVQALHDRLGLLEAQQRVAQLVRDQHPTAEAIGPVRLLPFDRAALAQVKGGLMDRPWLVLAGYGSVYEQRDLATILGLGQPFTSSIQQAMPLTHAAGVITCWGDGRLRWNKATPQAIKVICEDLIGIHEMESLIRIRQDQPHLDAQQAVRLLRQPHRIQQQLMKRLTDASRCHALVVSMKQDGRRHTFMSIEEKRDDGSWLHHTYEQDWP